MIADFSSRIAPRRPNHVRRIGRRHRARVERAAPTQRNRWLRFLDDRQALRLKLFLLGCCLLAVALLEVPR